MSATPELRVRAASGSFGGRGVRSLSMSAFAAGSGALGKAAAQITPDGWRRMTAPPWRRRPLDRPMLSVAKRWTTLAGAPLALTI